MKEQEIHHCTRADAGLVRARPACTAIPPPRLCGLHLSNGFWQVGGDFRQSFSSAVDDVVAAGAGLRTLQDAARRRRGRVVTWTQRQKRSGITRRSRRMEAEGCRNSFRLSVQV